MTGRQTLLVDLISLERIHEQARASDFRYGKAIHDRGGVEFIERGPLDAKAWVGGLDGSTAEGGSRRRRTRLFVTGGSLQWLCTGNPKDHQIFCKHCVALALQLLDSA